MPNEQDSRASNPPSPQTKSSVGHWLLAGAICLFAAAYTLGVVLGIIPQNQKIDATNLIVLALAGFCAILLVNPEALERLRHLKVAGFEFDLAKNKRQQEQQQGQLEAISLLLPLVLREEETKHLRYLAEQRTTGYVANHDMRTEVRRLRTMGLIENLAGRSVGEMKDGMKADLAEYVRLTSFGHRMVTQLVEIEKAKTDKAL
jgi:hypothetical protein